MSGFVAAVQLAFTAIFHQYFRHSKPVSSVTFEVVLQPKRPFMLRTLPSRHFAELEELLPEALSNSTMVNGLECKLSNRSSKVCFFMPAIMCELPKVPPFMMCALSSPLLMLLLLLIWLAWQFQTIRCLLQVSYVIETSDAFLRRKHQRHGMSTLVQRRADKFHDWYRPHEMSMIPAYAAVLGI